MKTFKIPVVYQVWGVYQVGAETIEKAEEKVFKSGLGLPVEGHYIEDSMEIDRDSEFYGEIKP